MHKSLMQTTSAFLAAVAIVAAVVGFLSICPQLLGDEPLAPNDWSCSPTSCSVVFVSCDDFYGICPTTLGGPCDPCCYCLLKNGSWLCVPGSNCP